MDKNIAPGPHSSLWVNLLGAYVTEATEALSSDGLQIDRSWLDPTCPRDATIVLAGARALVFDEVTGWRYGRFISGQQGVRTVLSDVSYVGGGVLPDARELTHKVINGVAAPCREYRSFDDLHDGLDDALRGRDVPRRS